MADHLVEGPPNKRPKLNDTNSTSSSDVIGNQLFDLEKNLPDELFSQGGGWDTTTVTVSQAITQQQQAIQRPPTMGPTNPGIGMTIGLGTPAQNGSLDPQHQHQLSHILPNKTLMNNMSGGAVSGSALGQNNIGLPNSTLNKSPHNSKLNSPPGTTGMMMNTMGNGPPIMSIQQQQPQQPTMNNVLNPMGVPMGINSGNVPMKTPVSMISTGQMGQSMHNGPMMSSARPVGVLPNSMLQQQQQQQQAQQQQTPLRGPPIQGMNPQGPRLQGPGIGVMGPNTGPNQNVVTNTNYGFNSVMGTPMMATRPMGATNGMPSMNSMQSRFSSTGPDSNLNPIQTRPIMIGGGGGVTVGGTTMVSTPGPATPTVVGNQGATQTNVTPQQPQPVNSLSLAASTSLNPSTAPPNPVQSAPSSAATADPEKRKLIQQQLVLLLHAHKCQRRENQANGECSLPHCRTMKNVLNHMTTCSAGKTCQVPHCSSSRQIISHWKNCSRSDCPVCLPLKQADRSKKIPEDPPSTASNAQSSPAPSDVSLIKSVGNTPVVPAGQGLMPSTLKQPIPSATVSPLTNTSVVGGSRTVPQIPNQPQQQPNMVISNNAQVTSPPVSTPGTNPSLPPTSTVNRIPVGPASGSASNPSIPVASHSSSGDKFVKNRISDNPNLEPVIGGASPIGSMSLPGGLQSSQVTADPVQGSKEWHQSVSPDLRNHLVQKLVLAIFPTPDPQAMLDKRMHNLVAYARKVESDMYKMADSRSEYYHLLAEKIYKIQKELDEKRQKRKEQQQAMHPPPDQPAPQIPSLPQPPPPQPQNQQAPTQPMTQSAGLRPPVPGMINPSGPRMPPTANPGSIIGNNNLVRNQGPVMVQVPNQMQQQRPTMQSIRPEMVGPPNQTVPLPQLSPYGSVVPGVPISISNSSFQNSNVVSQQQQQQPQPPVQFSNHMSAPPYPMNPQQRQAQIGMVGMQSQQQLSSELLNERSTPNGIPAMGMTSAMQNILPNTPGGGFSETPSGLPLSVSTPASNTTPMHSGLDSNVTEVKAEIKTEPGRLIIKKEIDQPEVEQLDSKDIDSQSIEIKAEPAEVSASVASSMDGGGNDEKMDDSRQEIKMEPMEDNSFADPPAVAIPVKEEIKEEPSTPMSAASNMNDTNSSDIKPTFGKEPVSTPGPSTVVPPVVRPPGVNRPGRIVFSPDELRQALMPTLEKLFRQDPESIPFREPVDPMKLCIPDYFDIIKRPMDLSTIKRKLDTGQYKDPWEYVDDVWLMFDNAWLYNRKTSRVYRCCTKLSEVFEQEIDPVMQSLGYCCGRKYTFNPQVLCCYGKQLCSIPRDAKYFSYHRYTYCVKCFNEIQGETVTLGDDPSQPTTVIRKDQFIEMKNDALDLEPFVDCQECGRKLHQICVLHMDCIWPQGFVCDLCLKSRKDKRKENKFGAKRLPTTKLSTFIENRVNNFLKKKEAGAGEVSIRVVASSDKITEVKPGMKSRYVDNGELCETFPYRAKALFAFEEIDGTDVCFFGMHVQEYGSECPGPNTRRVYLAYLDSVHFFRPKQFRTAVYHEILLGYLDYVKQLGYCMAHIWACPPSEGDDYIFHCHPPDQKIPKPKRLQDWYKKMLDRGIIERIVLDYKDILKQAMEDNLTSAAELPYFEGDFWPNVLEESIKELDQEEEEKRRQAEAAEAAAAAVTTEETDIGSDGKKKGQKKAKKSNKAKASNRKNNKKSNAPQTGNDLSAKIFATMEKHKEVFFVIRLHSAQSAASLAPIVDPDPFIQCDLMDGRDAFLTLARDKHYEFSSLRRAKFSTMAMLYELHNQGQDRFVYTCNNCKAHVETRFHCTVCDDFDLCVPCYEKCGHPHKMDKLGLDLDVGSSPSDAKQTNPQEARKLSIQRCIQSLVHACQCRDANCRLQSCQKMKRVVTHTRSCKRKTNGGCPVCKQLIALCCYHAKHCQETKCPVPFCSNIRQKLRQQQLQQRLQQAQLVRRRMAAMSTMATVGSRPPGTPGSMSGPSGMGGPASPLESPSSSDVIGMTHHQPGVGMKPTSQTPPANVLQVVKQVQEEARAQQGPQGVVSFGKGGLMNVQHQQQQPQQPVMTAANPSMVMPPPQMQMQMPRPMNIAGGMGMMGPMPVNSGPVPQPGQNNNMGMAGMQISGGMGNMSGRNMLPGMDQWNRFSNPTQNSGQVIGQQNVGTRQITPNIMPSQPQQPIGMGMLNQATGPNMQPNQGPPQGVMVGGGTPGQQRPLPQALQQLLQTLKSPSTPQQQQQVVQILRSNPQLMAAFIKQRSLLQQQQQNQQGLPQGQQQQNQQQIPNNIQQQSMVQSGLQGALQGMQPQQQQQPQQQGMQANAGQQGMMGGVNMNPGPPNQQWFRQQQQQQHILAMQRQQQQQGFQQPSPVQQYSSRARHPHPGMGFSQQQQQQHGFGSGGDQFMSPNNPGQFSGQQQAMQQLLQQQQQIKNTPPPTMSPSPQQQGIMVPPSASPQHLMHRSPPPSSLPQTVRSPQPNPSPRLGVPAAVPSPSPRQPAPSPRMASQSPHPSMGVAGAAQQLSSLDPDSLLQSQSAMMNIQDQQETAQDQLSKYVENL